MKAPTTDILLEAHTPLAADELHLMDAYWRACNYLSLGMLYLCGNPLLREPLRVEHIKKRLIGHWGSAPGQNFIWVHGYNEKGGIHTPLALAILNQVDRFSLAIDVIDRVLRLQESGGAHVKNWLQDQILEHLAYAHEHGIDPPAIRNWKWPYT